MANYNYVKGQTDLSAAATWGGTAPSTPWAAGDTATFPEGGPVTFTVPAALVGINLGGVEFQPQFTSDIGSQSSPIQLQINNASGNRLDVNFGGSYAWFSGNGNTIRNVWWRPVSGGQGSLINAAISQTLFVSGGVFKVGADCTLVDVRTAGTGAIDIPGHSGGTDELGDITMQGRSTIYLARKLGTGKTCRIPSGCKVTVNFDGTHDGTFVLDGGELVVMRGTMTITGNAGTLDATKYAGTGTLTISDAPDLTEKYGPNVPTVSRGTTWGSGSKRFYS